MGAHILDCADVRAGRFRRAPLTQVLDRGLPQYPASLALKRRLEAEWPVSARGRPLRRGARRAGVVAGVVLVPLPRPGRRACGRRACPALDARAALVTEAVNDHLRVLARASSRSRSERGGIHQVKPWFEGRLDFAPVVAFEGDAEFKLGGARSATSWIDGPPCSSIATPAPRHHAARVPRGWDQLA